MNQEDQTTETMFPRRHQLLAALTDSTVATTICYAIFVHLIRFPELVAAKIAGLVAATAFLVLAVVIRRGTFKPLGGTFLYASAPTLGYVAGAVGMYVVYLLSTGPVVAAYLPMLGALSAGLLGISAARQQSQRE